MKLSCSSLALILFTAFSSAYNLEEAFESRDVSLANKAPAKLTFKACDGPRNSNGSCTGSCRKYTVKRGGHVQAPGTNCLVIETKGVPPKKVSTCAGACHIRNKECNPISKGNKSQCQGKGGCWNVPYTDCIYYRK